ncbi:unnamed protein product [Protopolystoma xenopodis]|uniref:Uncharacterized protein n=1 Tax=Protopolystoma xenopodis TaxID=117903 RepID=A0A3S5B7E6_9PLAT|nr:unnamed protein product [Protopolystoma xenopodis]
MSSHSHNYLCLRNTDNIRTSLIYGRIPLGGRVPCMYATITQVNMHTCMYEVEFGCSVPHDCVLQDTLSFTNLIHLQQANWVGSVGLHNGLKFQPALVLFNTALRLMFVRMPTDHFHLPIVLGRCNQTHTHCLHLPKRGFCV